MAQADAFLRARSLQELGELARDFGLNAALRAPMQRVLGEAPIPGRMTREIAQLAAALGTDDVAALLMDGEALLATPAKRGVKQKLFEHARTYLYQAAQAEDGGATPPAPPPSQPTRASAPSPSSRADGPPRDEAALRAWAAAEGVGPLLEQTAFRTLSDGQPELFRGWTPPEVARATLADVLCDRDLLEGGDAVVRRQLARVQEATWAFLQAAAKDATRAVEEEAALPWLSGAVPEGQARQALAGALLAARRGVRSAVSPRSAERRRPWSVAVEAGELPTATYQEEAESRLAFPVKVTVRVRDDQGLELRSTHSGTDVDPYVLSALDALLARVYDPDDQSLGPLLDAFAHPPWLRGLMALEAAVADPEAAAREGALGWWLGFEPTLGVRPAHLKLKRDGGLARPKPVDLSVVLADEGLGHQDRRAAELLDLADVAARRASQDAQRLTVQAVVALAGHPRIFVGDEVTPMALVRGTLGLTVDAAQDGFHLVPDLDGVPLPLGQLAHHRVGRGAGGLIYVMEEARVLFDVVRPAYERALAVLTRFTTPVPREQEGELVARLAALAAVGPVRFSAAVARSRVPAAPRLVLRLTGDAGGARGEALVRYFQSAPPLVPGEGPEEAVAARPDRTLVFTPRDLASERAWAASVLGGLVQGADDFRFELATPEAVFALLDAARREDGVEVEWGARPWRVERAVTEDLRVEVRDRPDWFGLEGGVEVDGARVALALLLDAARAGRRYVQVDDDAFVVLEEALMARLAAVEPLVHERRGEATVSRAALAEVEALGRVAGEFEAGQGFRAAVAKMQDALRLEPELPAGLQADLRPYQQAGFRWMARLATWGLGAVLADDMGLGKTLQTLAVLLYRAAEGPALVVAPTSVTFNWAREAARFTPGLTVRRYLGADRAAALAGLGPGDVVVVSYGLAVRDEAAFSSVEWASMVLDEAQAVKNAQAQRSQAIRRIPAKWRLALSGTPVENRLSELWSLFRVVEPGLFGSWERFKTSFATPIERDGDAARAEALSRAIRPFVLRRTKRAVAPELPPRTDVVVDVVLSEPERALYEDVRLATLARLEEGTSEEPAGQGGRFQVLAALTRLRQLACHPRLDDPASEVPSAKLARVMHLVADLLAEGQRALVFSQFTQHLALVQEALQAAGIPYLHLDGSTPEAERARRVDAFQAGEAALFLISLKAGGTGLNLTAADNVILLDPWWNPAVEDQATDRAHRIGRDAPVTVYRLVAQNTVEDAIYALHATKRALVGQVLDGTGAAAAMDMDELMGLIRGDAGR